MNGQNSMLCLAGMTLGSLSMTLTSAGVGECEDESVQMEHVSTPAFLALQVVKTKVLPLTSHLDEEP